MRRRLAAALLALVVLPGLRVDAGATVVELHDVQGAAFSPAPGGPVFVLVLGSDERAGLDGARADAIHLVGVNPAAGQATVVNLPRDTWVGIPGHGSSRINEAYHFGGPQLAAETVAALTGVFPALVAVTTFDGLVAMVDEMGGLDVGINMPMDDPNSGAAFEPGIQRLTGGQVLAYARNRHVPGGDLTRTQHQGELIVAALSQLRNEGGGPAAALRKLSVLVRHTRVEGVSVTDLYRLGLVGLSIDPALVRNITPPARLGFVGTSSVVFLTGEAGGLFADFADDAILQAH